jgi:hypothetical protein
MTKETKKRESHSGFHFINLYMNCPRKFFIKYIARVLPLFTDSALTFGGAFHEGKEVFYKTSSEKKGLNRIKTVIKRAKELYEHEDEYERDLFQAPTLFEKWVYDYGYNDLEIYSFFKVEEEIKVRLGKSKFFMTIKPDAIVDNVDGYSFILETKTSRFSINLAINGVTYGDQATAYLWGARKAYPKKKIEGVIPDIAYFNKNATRVSNCQCARGDIVFRSGEETKEFEYTILDNMVNVSQRVEALKTGRYHPHQLFGRNTSWCNAFFRVCEYASICRQEVPLKGKIRGFKRDMDSRPLNLGDLTGNTFVYD